MTRPANEWTLATRLLAAVTTPDKENVLLRAGDHSDVIALAQVYATLAAAGETSALHSTINEGLAQIRDALERIADAVRKVP